jgi:hypothetical protein
MLSKENLIEINYKNLTNKNLIKLDNSLVDFIFQFCTIANLSRETSQSTIYIFQMFVSNVEYMKMDLQLITMGCILICSKIFDVKPISLSTIHRISQHVYNNSMLLQVEKKILKAFDYDLFIRDKVICDRVGMYLESIRFLIQEEKDFNSIMDLAMKISDLIFEDMSILKEIEINLLCVSIIHTSVIMATRREGKLPITIRLAIIANVTEEEIMKTSKRLIKHCLGKEVYKKYTF